MAARSADIQKKRIISPTNFENKSPNLPDLLVDLQSIPEFLFLVGEIHIPSYTLWRVCLKWRIYRKFLTDHKSNNHWYFPGSLVALQVPTPVLPAAASRPVSRVRCFFSPADKWHFTCKTPGEMAIYPVTLVIYSYLYTNFAWFRQ